MSQHTFQITLGPVQGFVAQARKTRDFWAGSFLLSWLSGVAMCDVRQQGGVIHFPAPDDEFMDALTGRSGMGPMQGAVPNRFKAVCAEVPAAFDPERVVSAIRWAWMELAEAVWNANLESVLRRMDEAQYGATRNIWERQVGQFWEISWCLGDDDSSANLLDLRKNIRNHLLPDEPGVKCMMMDGMQELSGVPAPHRAESGDFWAAIRDHVGVSYLREGEQLCALAFIKRMFVRPFGDLKVDMEGWQLHGWPLPESVPSVTYMAAVHWVEAAIAEAKDNDNVVQAWQALAQSGKKLTNGFNERQTRITCLDSLRGIHADVKQWQGLDGNLFFPHLLQNTRDYPDQQLASKAISAFSQLKSASALPEPSPFYAILLMDGDSLGSQMADKSKQTSISRALRLFTTGLDDQDDVGETTCEQAYTDISLSVPEIVAEHNGSLIYMGGDDVLALLPLEDAQRCALALRSSYESCFSRVNAALDHPITTTLSGAVVYAHIKQPLTQSLSRAHVLLDSVAKDQTGRDSLAIEVWKPGSRHLCWAMPWQYAVDNDGLIIDRLVEAWQAQGRALMSSGFLRKLITLLDRMGMAGLEMDLVHALAIAEFRRSMAGVDTSDLNVNALVDDLLQLSRRMYRVVEGNDVKYQQRHSQYQPDLLKLMLFLVQKEI